jgi:uncharacterized membrane protein YdbT with pleckstrin-like domain
MEENEKILATKSPTLFLLLDELIIWIILYVGSMYIINMEFFKFPYLKEIATGILLIIFLIYFIRFLKIINTRYQLTTQRLKMEKGVLNKYIDEIELYRIKDYQVEKPLFQRLIKCGNIKIYSSDRNFNYIKLKGIKNVEIFKDMLRLNVEKQRKIKGVREFD